MADQSCQKCIKLGDDFKSFCTAATLMCIECELQNCGSQTSESNFSFCLKEHLTGDTEEHLDIFAQPAQQRIIVVWPDYRMLAAVGM